MGLRIVSAAVLAIPFAPIAKVASAQAWNLHWSDEFNAPAGTSPSSDRWTYDTGGGGWGNKEVEVYCAPGSNAAPCDAGQPNLYQDGKGNLVIHAISNKGTWTSGRMKTAGKEAFQYGRIEARMKLAFGDGFWPAFWMLGNSKTGWPASGEQDIMEWVQSYGPNTTSSTIHGPGYSGAHGIGSRFTFPNGERIDNGYHTYGVVWSKDRLQFYRDNPAQPYLTITPASLPAGTAWVYNQPFFVLLNFAIGSGGFPGTTDDSTPASATALVDYVRVYQASQTIDPGKWYVISSKQNGACLYAAPTANSAEALLEQQRCQDGQAKQQWQLRAAADNSYMVTARNGTAAWDGGQPATAGAGDTTIHLRSPSGAADQQWRLVATGEGTYTLVAQRRGLCLDASFPEAVNNSALQQRTCDGTDAQAFVLTEAP